MPLQAGKYSMCVEIETSPGMDERVFIKEDGSQLVVDDSSYDSGDGWFDVIDHTHNGKPVNKIVTASGKYMTIHSNGSITTDPGDQHSGTPLNIDAEPDGTYAVISDKADTQDMMPTVPGPDIGTTIIADLPLEAVERKKQKWIFVGTTTTK